MSPEANDATSIFLEARKLPNRSNPTTQTT